MLKKNEHLLAVSFRPTSHSVRPTFCLIFGKNLNVWAVYGGLAFQTISKPSNPDANPPYICYQESMDRYPFVGVSPQHAQEKRTSPGGLIPTYVLL